MIQFTNLFYNCAILIIYFVIPVICAAREDQYIFPLVSDVDIGKSITVMCTDLTEPKWFFNKGPLPDNAKVVSNLLTIMSAQAENDGIYNCYGGREVSLAGTTRTQNVVSYGRINVYGK